MKQTALVFLVILASVVPTVSAQTLTERLVQEQPAKLAADINQRGNAARGAVLFAEQKLACANCHASGQADLLGPDLSRLGKDATETHLIESVLQPSKKIREGFETVRILTAAGRVITGRVVDQNAEILVVRDTSAERRIMRIPVGTIEAKQPSKVSAMPDKLIDQLNDRQQFLDLMRYVFEVVAAGPTSNENANLVRGGKEIDGHLKGLVLLNELNCRSCHAIELAETSLPKATAPDLNWSGGHIDPLYISNFLSDPHGTKPDTRMPDAFPPMEPDDKSRTVAALTQYIVSLGDANFDTQELSPKSAQKGKELFHSVGCVACHLPRDNAQPKQTKSETIAKESVLLGEVGDKFSLASLIEFLENPHVVRPAGRMPNMQLSHWEAIDIANYLLQGQESNQTQNFTRDPNLVALGKTAFSQIGCVRCHETPESKQPATISKLTASSNLSDGCLSSRSGTWPKYVLSDEQKDDIRQAIMNGRKKITDEERIAVNLTAMRCLNCHDRGELGGVSEDRNPHFQTTNPNLGPQGRIPPTLTGVGAKLKPKWMRQVLVSGRKIRPYVKTRMPQYGAENVAHLVDMFQKVDALPPMESVPFKDQKEIRKVGLELAGTKGLNCIVCHTFQLKPAATMPAVDLTEMTERLHKDWFHRYMMDPQSLNPGTVMPSFWPGGKAIRKDVLEGKPDKQVEALWQYLLDGRQARTPQGLIREPMELLATDEAVMLRRKYPEIGKRGIGVGYPSLVNIAYDAEQMRLATIWRGKFADPGGVWRSQGHGSVRPLERPIQFLKGPDVDDADSPWVVDETRPPNHQFKGYSLDEKRRPKFMYTVGDTKIEDYFVDLIDPSSKQPILIRKLSIQSKQSEQELAFRVADGKEIVPTDDGGFIVDQKLRVYIAKPHVGAVIDSAPQKEIQVKLDGNPEKSAVEVKYVW